MVPAMLINMATLTHDEKFNYHLESRENVLKYEQDLLEKYKKW